MKKLLPTVDVMVTSTVFIGCTLMLYFSFAIGGEYLLLAYPYYLIEIIVGFGMLKYQNREIYAYSVETLQEEVILESKVFIISVMSALILHISGLINLYLMIFVDILILIIGLRIVLVRKAIITLSENK